MQKSLNWVVVGIAVGRVYEVDDRRRIQTVELCNGTYQELVYPVGEVSSWQIPNYLPVVKPPHMDKQPSGRPKSMKHIRSQGEEPVTVRCGRKGHILEEAHSKQMTTSAINAVVNPHGFEGIFKDGDGVLKLKNFKEVSVTLNTERLSRSDEVLKLKNFKKDASLKLSSYQIKKGMSMSGSKSHKFTRLQSLQDSKTKFGLVDGSQGLKIT
ncbi:hypothetical protein Tco_0611477 [Tanacetum coccineum]